MYRALAVAAALCLFGGVAVAQTNSSKKPAEKQDKPAPKTNAGGAAAGGADPKFVTNNEKVSYGIGLEIGGNVKNNLMNMAGPMFKELKLEAVLWGIHDGLKEEGSRVGEAELLAAQTDFQKRLEKIVKELGDKNLKAAQAFLASNKSKPGVQTTKSGLQYKVIKSGKGPTPKASDWVRVHYTGSRTDGSVFESTKQSETKEPAELQLQLLIPGWQEAITKMKVGDVWTIYVPPDLAYGEMGRDGIEPNTLLIFELELVGIIPPDELTSPADAGAPTEEETAPKEKAAAKSGGATTKKPASPR